MSFPHPVQTPRRQRLERTCLEFKGSRKSKKKKCGSSTGKTCALEEGKDRENNFMEKNHTHTGMKCNNLNDSASWFPLIKTFFILPVCFCSVALSVFAQKLLRDLK